MKIGEIIAQPFLQVKRTVKSYISIKKCASFQSWAHNTWTFVNSYGVMETGVRWFGYETIILTGSRSNVEKTIIETYFRK